MQNLEVERPETSHPQPKMTIFSQVLATPVDKQKTVETPLILFPPLLKMRPYGVPPTPWGQVEQQVYAGCYLFSGPIEPRTRW